VLDGRDVAELNAYEMARAGGRHAGLLRSYERQVDLHRQKLRNSEQFVTDWAMKSARIQEGLLRHWRQDLARNQELAEVMRGILRDRGIQP
jgi:hypothetical protein